MYKNTSQNSQTRAFRGVYLDTAVAAGRKAPVLKGEQMENLRRAIQDAEVQANKLPKDSRERRAVVVRLETLRRQMALLRSEKAGPKIDYCRIQVVFKKLVEAKLGEEPTQVMFNEAKAVYRAETGISEEWLK